MQFILLALFAVGAFADSHTEYGLPLETPKLAPYAPAAPALAPYPATKVIVPHNEYGVPVEQPKIKVAPVVSSYEYKFEAPIAKVAPYPAAVPHDTYGLPVEQPQVYVAPVTSKYNFEIPAEVKLAPYSARIEVPHEVYGAPKLAPYPAAKIEIPHEVYGVPTLH